MDFAAEGFFSPEAAAGFVADFAAGFFATGFVPYSSSAEGFAGDVPAAAVGAGLASSGFANEPSGRATGFAAAAAAVPAAVAVAAVVACFASSAFLAARSLSYRALRSEKLSCFPEAAGACFFSSLPISPTFAKASSGFLNGSSEFGS